MHLISTGAMLKATSMNVMVRLSVLCAMTTPSETQVMRAIRVTKAKASTKRTATGILNATTILAGYLEILQKICVRIKINKYKLTG